MNELTTDIKALHEETLNNLKTSKADQSDMLFNFMSQFLRVTTGTFDEPFKTLVNQGMIGGPIHFLLLKKNYYLYLFITYI